MSEFPKKNTQQLPMVPNAVAALILAIGGCVHGWVYGVPGIIMGAIALSLAKKAQIAMTANPDGYRGLKFIQQAIKWGKTSITQGIILTVVYALIITLYIAIIVVIIFSRMD